MCNHNMASSREVAFIEDEPIRRSEQAALASLIQSSFALTSHCKTAKPPSSSNPPQKSSYPPPNIPAPPQSISNPSTASSTGYSQCSCLCPRFPLLNFLHNHNPRNLYQKLQRQTHGGEFWSLAHFTSIHIPGDYAVPDLGRSVEGCADCEAAEARLTDAQVCCGKVLGGRRKRKRKKEQVMKVYPRFGHAGR